MRESGEIRCGPVAGELQSTMTKYAELRVLFPLFPSNSIYQNICLSVGFLMKSPNGPESDHAKLNCPIPITRQKCGAIGWRKSRPISICCWAMGSNWIHWSSWQRNWLVAVSSRWLQFTRWSMSYCRRRMPTKWRSLLDVATKNSMYVTFYGDRPLKLAICSSVFVPYFCCRQFWVTTVSWSTTIVFTQHHSTTRCW